jgi:parallel beta-helix repeat protein
MLVTNATNFLIADMTFKETKGDGIKVKDSKGVTIVNIATEWDTPESPENGAYGIYPVLCEDVMIDHCYARGSSDAGIYVGQSNNAIIKKSLVENNVVGIEVENTIGADIFENTARNNTCGIMVLDLQNLKQPGDKIRLFDNRIENNNGNNFAPPGNMASLVPAGTGIMLLASRGVEVFDNAIKGNNVVGLGLVSFITIQVLAGFPIEDPNYNPFYYNIYLHDNQFDKTDEINTTGQTDMGLLLLSIFGKNPVPDIVSDGIFAQGTGESGGFCLHENGEAGFVNLDVMHNFANLSFDADPHACEGTEQVPVTVDTPVL